MKSSSMVSRTLLWLILVGSLAKAQLAAFKDFDGFSVFKGKVNSYITRHTPTICKCWTICFVTPDCNFFSWEVNKTGIFNCMTSTTDNLDTGLSEYTPLNSYVGIRNELLESLVKEDGFIYWKPEGTFTYEEAKSVCASRLGSKLPIVKTRKQIEILESFGKHTSKWVQMEQVTGHNVGCNGKFSDGTYLADTELEGYISCTLNALAEGFIWNPTLKKFIGHYHVEEVVCQMKK